MLGLHWMASAAFHFWRFSSIHFVATVPQSNYSPRPCFFGHSASIYGAFPFIIFQFPPSRVPSSLSITIGNQISNWPKESPFIPGNKTASAGQDQQEFGWSMSIPPRIISIPSNPFPLKLDIRFRRYSLHILILMNASFRCKSWFIVKFANSNGNRSANQINIFLNW